jgi:hypothetical protein
VAKLIGKKRFFIAAFIFMFSFSLYTPAGELTADEAGSETVSGNPLRLDLYLYFWPAGLNGDVSADNHTAHTSLKFRDILDDLKMGANGAFRISKGDWFLFNDFIYLDLAHKTSEDISSIPGASVDATLSTRVVTDMLVAGRKWEKPFSWNLFAGARYFYGRVRLDAIERLGPYHAEALEVKTDEWVTPVVGAGVNLPINNKLSFNFTADAGAASKSFNWEVLPSISWKINEKISAEAGYRLLDIRHKENGFKIDTLMHGPIVGMKMSF